MRTFREFLASQDQPAITPAEFAPKKKLWKATKDEIVSWWKTLRPDTPILMRPIDYEHTGSTYGEDGLRMTGSPQFIASVLARLKEFLQFETPNTKLSLVYRQTESPSQSMMGQDKTSYVFYVQARERGNKPEESGQSEEPEGPKGEQPPKPPTPPEPPRPPRPKLSL